MPGPSDITAASASLLPDNTTKQIDAADVRNVFQVVADALTDEAAARLSGDAYGNQGAPAIPAAPTLTTVTTKRDAWLLVEIASVSLATSYEVELTLDADDPTYSLMGGTKARIKIDRGSVCEVRVCSIAKNGSKSLFSSPATITAATDAGAPATPTWEDVQTGFGSIFVQFSKNTEDDFDHCELFESEINATPPYSTTGQFSTKGSTFTRTGLPQDHSVTLYYCVRAIDDSGNRSAWSSPIQASTTSERELAVRDQYGNPIISSTGEIGGDAYVVINGNNVLVSDIAAASLIPSINYVGEFNHPPTSGELGVDWAQNAVYRNTVDGNNYILTGTPLDWELYVESGSVFVLTIESTNGSIFRVGVGASTLLKARLFKNGAEVTDVTPDTWFRWRRVSMTDPAPPNNDAAFNAAYASGGYKEISITVDTVAARATFFCDIVST